MWGEKVIYIWIPEGTQVRRLNGRILDRTYEGDIDITDNAELVYKMYARKQSTYFVNKVYPKLGMEFLEKVLRWRQFCYLEKTVQSCRSYQKGQMGYSSCKLNGFSVNLRGA